MDIQRINNTIAEILGYKNIRLEWIIGVTEADSSGMDYLQWYGNYDGLSRRPIPNFFGSLEAMQKAEMFYSPRIDEIDSCSGDYILYAENLCKVCGYNEHERVKFSWKVFTATSAQRAVAFLMTAERYEEFK